ncbi:tetratricopeptide repeat protein [Winogradskyella tangerina]|uniref:tetratricopeptide repeat protein n=1 Tax=Winogradskyella tangerina TaxID=2023240 RepID=UPI000DBE04D1|nr:hypothetical protein [Winogradskyella tangerina]
MNIEDDILIEKFLRDQLSEAERSLFTERLEVDADFKTQFTIEKQLFETLDEQNWSFIDSNNEHVDSYKKILASDDIQSLKKTLIATNASQNDNGKPSNSTRRLFYYLAAASIVIFLGFQFFFNQNITSEALYNDYVNLDGLPSFVSRNDTENKLSEAQKLFQDEKYEEALIIFESELNSAEAKGNVLIYQGISQIQLKRYSEAEITFNTLINSDLIDAEKGYWYKALLYLKQDKVDDARNLLHKIKDEKLFNFENASNLLKELD